MVKNVYGLIVLVGGLTIICCVTFLLIFNTFTGGCAFLEYKSINNPELNEISCSKLKAYIDFKEGYTYEIITNSYCKGKLISSRKSESWYGYYMLKEEYLRRCI